MTLEQFIKYFMETRKDVAPWVAEDIYVSNIFQCAKTAVAHGYFDKQTETDLLRSEVQILRDSLKQGENFRDELRESLDKEIAKNEFDNELGREVNHEVVIDEAWNAIHAAGGTICSSDLAKALRKNGYRIFAEKP